MPAPEILRIAESGNNNSERAIVSPAVDIWALGVCIYALIVGSRPFSDPFQPRITMLILANEWDRERLRQKGGDDALRLVEGCLTTDVADRWTISDVLDSAWLREEMEKDDQDASSMIGWRL